MTVDLSIVVLSWNTVDLLRACLTSLREDSSEQAREVIVVDNASADGSADMVAEEFPEVRLIRNSENMLYSAGNNIGARAAQGRWLCLLNSDTEVRAGSLDALCSFLEQHDDYAMVGPRFVGPDGTLQTTCSLIPGLLAPVLRWTGLIKLSIVRKLRGRQWMFGFDHMSDRDVEQPLGACVVMRREEYAELGGLDEQLSLFFNDVDICLRLKKAGRKVRFLADAVVMHHWGASTKKRREEFGNPLWHANQIAFYRKHYGWFGGTLLRSMLRISTWKMFARILLSRRERADKRAALDRLRSFKQRSLGRA